MALGSVYPKHVAENLARLLGDARRIAILTGAGISTDSGIPDFRSPEGLWTRLAPVHFRDFTESAQARREAWRRRFASEKVLAQAKPNSGHRAVAALISCRAASAVITQNIDNLHQDAGVPAERVVEIHGNTRYAKCLNCGERIELAPIRAHFEKHGDPPNCRCGGMIKTATISFGQPMPETELKRAEVEAQTCDVFLVLGSSLAVYPAAGLPLLARRNGAKLIIINREPTALDGEAGLVVNGEIGSILPPIAAQVASARGLATSFM